MLYRASAATLALALAAGMHAPAVASQPLMPKVELAQATTQGEPDLAAYATATVKVLQIQQAMNNEISAAAGQEDASRIQAEAQAAMVAAVEGEGLTVEEYNTIAEMTRADPQVAATVERLIREQLGG
jgi:hypothetical protein